LLHFVLCLDQPPANLFGFIWANVVRHNPAIQEGDWIAYYNGESKKGDTLWLGRAKIINPDLEPEDQVIADGTG
jgi:hypothetical protein